MSACACARVCALAGARAGARVMVHLCLYVRERTGACVGAHACALEGGGLRMCGRACVRSRIMHVCFTIFDYLI